MRIIDCRLLPKAPFLRERFLPRNQPGWTDNYLTNWKYGIGDRAYKSEQWFGLSHTKR